MSNQSEIENLRASVAKHEADISRMVDAVRGYCAQGMALPIENIGGMEGAVIALAAEAIALRARVEKLEKALRPFARLNVLGGLPDRPEYRSVVRAREALAAAEAKP